jgi:hypothetical protein
MNTLYLRILAFAVTVYLMMPDWCLAAGPAAKELIVVADTRRVTSPYSIYFLNLYNTDPTLFGVWCLILTVLWGAILGFSTDFIMKHTGLDLESRTIVEH